MIIWKFIESKLQQEWTKTFSYFCQKSNIDLEILEQYENKFLKPLLNANPKTIVPNAIKIYQKNITINLDVKNKESNGTIKESEYDEFYQDNSVVKFIILLFILIIIILIFFWFFGIF